MTRKYRYLACAGILAACVCLTLGIYALLPQQGVTKGNFDRIEKGMTMAQVKAILGEPRDVDDKGGFWRRADGTHVFVQLKDNKVETTEFIPSQESLANMLRRWTGTNEE
jgi:hypothetical protein